MADSKNKTFTYKNTVSWQGQKKGLLSSPERQSFEVATPVEFKGHPGMWSPEDLFVAAVNVCVMTTFLYFMEREQVDVLRYESEAEGVLERVENRLIFSHVKIRPTIGVKDNGHREKVKEIMARAEKNCLISHSIKANVEVIPTIA